MSSDENSNSKTMRLSQKVNSIVSGSISSVQKNNLSKSSAVKKTNYFIRKTSHVLEYMILGFILTLACNKSFKISPGKSCSYVLLACILIANLDELYQSYVGRTSMVKDSLIDFCGSYIGFALYYIYDVLKIKA
jgi:VanZ family protein